jgi:hypothetical protein
MEIMTLLASLFLGTPYVERLDLHPRCAAAAVDSFKVQGVAAFPPETDYCELPATEELPAPVASMLDQIGALNAATAGKLGYPIRTLIPYGLRILMSPGASSTSIQPPNKVTLGVFPDWQGHALSAGEYVHELGHVIAFGAMHPESPLPRQLGSIWAQSMVLGEAFADLVAVQVTGQRRIPLSSHGVIPKGVLFDTYITDSLSFGDKTGNFLHGYRFIQMGDRCAELIKQGFAFDPKALKYCEELLLVRTRWLSRMPPQWVLDSVFDPGVCINEQGEMLEYQLCNPHPVGEVVVSFLLDLAERVKQDPMVLVLEGLRAAPRNPLFSCGHAMTEADPAGSPRRTAVELGTARALFAAIRPRLPGGYLSQFDEAWARHAMDRALGLDAIEVRQGPVPAARSFLRIFFSQSGTPEMNKDNYPCWGKLDDVSGDCRLSCVPVE